GELHTDDVTKLLSDSIDVDVHESVDVEAQSNFEYMRNYTNFAGYWIMLFLLILVGNIMSEFNSPELKQRINVSPMKTSTFMSQMILSQIVVGLFVVAFMFFGALALRTGSLSGVPLGKMFAALILITALTLSIHYVIGAITTNKFIINGLANFIAIGMAFLSGVMIPLGVMGQTAQNIAQYLRPYHCTQLYAEPDISWGEAAFPMPVTVLYTAAFLIIGMILENKSIPASSACEKAILTHRIYSYHLCGFKCSGNVLCVSLSFSCCRFGIGSMYSSGSVSACFSPRPILSRPFCSIA